ncbi:methylamine utilization protein [Oceanicoccus sp. KOV_DT_Chl]|uniref:methylamine utilization protein n=1 Tax=Oceanicoccus sp. KOV_DT_Chl TaxID=1904639 RepID=UPI000C7E0155|nr:methylamine utilization protein [Oceanicoccus sp. KOV_DT_Chl]
MDQVGKQFLPHLLVIQKGQTVTFPNSDNIRHHIYSFSQPKPFEIRMFKGGEFKTIAFDKPGIVVLGCNIHDQMIGYIYVADTELTAVTDSNGLATIEAATELTLWHSRLSANHVERVTVGLPAIVPQNHTVSLNLLPEKKAKPERKFGSKFGERGN